MPMPLHVGLGMLGDAPCPSVEQLLGITDISDPCQGANLPIATPALDNTVYGTFTPAQENSLLTATGAANPANFIVSPWMLAAAAGLFIVFASMGGGRR